METRSSKSKQKRQREHKNRPCAQRRSQRILEKSQSPSMSSGGQDEPMKITDINDFCLQKIFEHLDSLSLINVAIANEWLRPAASVIYKRKFGMKEVCISNNRYNAPFTSFSHHTVITGLKMCLPFLRCLGSSISGLTIWYHGWADKQCKYIHQYINRYCAESLVAIKFSTKTNSISIEPFEKPFVNVQTVGVLNTDLGNQWPSFAKWFPNMRSLKLMDVRTLCRIDLSKFDHLNELSINVAYDGGNSTGKKANSLLKQVPQLHSLDIRGLGLTMNTLLNIIKTNRVICNLKVNLFQYSVAANVLEIQRLINDHPMLIELEIMGLGFAFDTIMPLISQLNLLKQFRFQIVNRLEYNRLVAQLDGQWRSSFSDYKPPNHNRRFVQLERYKYAS